MSMVKYICIHLFVQMSMSVKSSMEDASKHVSTHRALITVSAAKASACTLMVGPALVSSKQEYLCCIFSDINIVGLLQTFPQ